LHPAGSFTIVIRRFRCFPELARGFWRRPYSRCRETPKPLAVLCSKALFTL